MRWARGMKLVISASAALAALSCGSQRSAATGDPTVPRTAPDARATAGPAHAARRLTDWPMFGLTPSRPSATNAATGITAASVARLQRRQVRVPGTIDSTPIILGDTAFATTTYGKTVAVDLRSGAIRWTFVPTSFGRVAGTAQITNASPAADPSRRFV